MNRRLIGLIIIWGILVAIAAGWLSVSSWLRAGEPERESVLYMPTRKSINYEVFKPALFLAEDIYFLFDGWIEFFKPSHLRRLRCDIAPASPEGIPFALLGKGFDQCYRENPAEEPAASAE